MSDAVKHVVLNCKKLPFDFICDGVNTLNAKKIGKHRRGSLFISKCEWTMEFEGARKFYKFVIEWQRPKFKYVILGVAGYKTKALLGCWLDYTDHNKLMKVLRSNRYVCQ